MSVPNNKLAVLRHASQRYLCKLMSESITNELFSLAVRECDNIQIFSLYCSGEIDKLGFLLSMSDGAVHARLNLHIKTFFTTPIGTEALTIMQALSTDEIQHKYFYKYIPPPYNSFCRPSMK